MYIIIKITSWCLITYIKSFMKNWKKRRNNKRTIYKIEKKKL